MNTGQQIETVLVNRFGAIDVPGVEITGRNRFVDQIELTYSSGCIIAVGRTLARTKAIDGRRDALLVAVHEGSDEEVRRTYLFENADALVAAVAWLGDEYAPAMTPGAVRRVRAGTTVYLQPVDAGSHADASADMDNCHVEPFIDVETAPAVRQVAEVLDCSLAAAAYIAALEARVSTLEEKVSELRYVVRRVRRAA